MHSGVYDVLLIGNRSESAIVLQLRGELRYEECYMEGYMKKKLIPISAMVVIIAALAITVICRYNTPKVAVGISHSSDGKVNYPVCSSFATSRLGLSASGQKKEQELMRDFREAVGNKIITILQDYSDHVQIDQTFELDHKYEILKD